MIRIIIDGEVVFTDPGKGYLKRNLKIDLVNQKGAGNPTQVIDIPLPVIRDYDLILGFGKRPDTDLELREEEARQEIMDKEGLRSIERERLQMAYDINDPHNPDYVAPVNETTEEHLERLQEALHPVNEDTDVESEEVTDGADSETGNGSDSVSDSGSDSSSDSGSFSLLEADSEKASPGPLTLEP